jgi:hypothetical protein
VTDEHAAGDGDGDGDPAGGVDYAWVMQTTFVVTIVVGAPVVALLAAFQPLPTWSARVGFAVRVGAVVWILTALGVFAYARRNDVGGGGVGDDDASAGDASDGEVGDSDEGVEDGSGDDEGDDGEEIGDEDGRDGAAIDGEDAPGDADGTART